LKRARTQSASLEAYRDRARRRHLGEGSFAEACLHHFKRSRWRRLERQQVQDWLIAAIQNIKLLTRAHKPSPRGTDAGNGSLHELLTAGYRAILDDLVSFFAAQCKLSSSLRSDRHFAF